MTAQTTSSVLMVRPAAFGFNPETAGSNPFQRTVTLTTEEVQRRALTEFDAFVALLRESGVDALVMDDTPEPAKTDAVFPNNWVTFHEDGTVVLYPMAAPSRRREVRRDLIDRLRDEHGFAVERVLDLTAYQEQDRFLEGTGSLILDRPARVAWAALSPRTHAELVTEVCATLGYEPRTFRATDAEGVPLYHTNVVMTLGSSFAIACLDAVEDPGERDALVKGLASGGRELVTISRPQMTEFVGNALELAGRDGPVIALSARARAALTGEQAAAIAAHGRLVTPDLATIETCGGGSARCMLAEVFLPRRGG